MKNVCIDSFARGELEDGTHYYDEQSLGLGDAFLAEVNRALMQLAEAPRSCPVVRGEIRRRPLFRFPYSLLYRVVDDHQVQIVAVMHQSRGPEYITSRLRSNQSDT